MQQKQQEQRQQRQQREAKLRGGQEECCRAEPSQSGSASGITAERCADGLGARGEAGADAPTHSWAAAGAAAYERLASAAAAARIYVGSWVGWPPLTEPSSSSREQGEGGGGDIAALPSGRVVAGTVVGAVLLYALYSERQAISRWEQSQLQGPLCLFAPFLPCPFSALVKGLHQGWVGSDRVCVQHVASA